MKAELITRRMRAARAAEQWAEQYRDFGRDRLMDGRHPTKILKALRALGPDPNPDAVDAVIGGGHWTHATCDGCEQTVGDAVVVGRTPECEGSTATLCRACVADALAAFGPPPVELRAAAERVIAKGDDSCYWRSPEAVTGAEALARAYLAEHPPDDGEPPTPDRLRAAGFAGDPADASWMCYGSAAVKLACFCEPSSPSFSVRGFRGKSVFDSVVIVGRLATMAAVRAWMRAVDAITAPQ